MPGHAGSTLRARDLMMPRFLRSLAHLQEVLASGHAYLRQGFSEPLVAFVRASVCKQIDGS